MRGIVRIVIIAAVIAVLLSVVALLASMAITVAGANLFPEIGKKLLPSSPPHRKKTPVSVSATTAAYDTLKDGRDGKTYRTVKMPDGKTWMAENLNYETPESSWCYDDSVDNGAKFGRLYNWKAAQTACPTGWHLSTRREWFNLAAAVHDDDRLVVAAAGIKLKSTHGWRDRDDTYNGQGTDNYGFSALPGGIHVPESRYDGIGISCFGGYSAEHVRFLDIGSHAYWWTTADAYGTYISGWGVNGKAYSSDYGLSVRCLRDEDTHSVTVLSAGANVTGGGRFEKGEIITVRTGTAPGKRFKKWTSVRGDAAFADPFNAITSFIMPANNVTVKAEYDAIIAKSDTFTDSRNGQTYKTALIGGKTWMAENLNYPTGKSQCHDNKISNCDKYGRLYDFNSAKKACPEGWHLPSRKEWEYLNRIAGDIQNDIYRVYGTAGMKLKAKSGWGSYRRRRGDTLMVSGNGTDDYGFSALPNGGYNTTVDWWTATEDGNNNAYYRKIPLSGNDMYESRGGKNDLCSVRCVQNGDDAPEENPEKDYERRIKDSSDYFTDLRDGRIYRTIKIGGKRWLAQNMAYQPQSGNSWCYGNDTSNCDKYGRLYDWRAATAACPSGWHLLSREEWNYLGWAVGGKEEPSLFYGLFSWVGAGKLLKTKSGWDDRIGKSGNGADARGFSALPGGYYENNGFLSLGDFAGWWTAIAQSRDFAYKFSISGNDLSEFAGNKFNGSSVRCVADK